MKVILNLIKVTFFLITGLYVFVEIRSSMDEKTTIDQITSGEINPPPKGLVPPSRQHQMISDFHREILDAQATFNDLSQRGSSDIAREVAQRDKKLLYRQREKAWNMFVSPVRFSGFLGRIEELSVSTVSGGPNNGKTRLKIEIVLFGTGMVLQEVILIDEVKDQWAERKISTPWQVLEEGLTVEISGNFIRASNERQWAMCCVSSTSYPELAINLSDLRLVE